LSTVQKQYDLIQINERIYGLKSFSEEDMFRFKSICKKIRPLMNITDLRFKTNYKIRLDNNLKEGLKKNIEKYGIGIIGPGVNNGEQ
jgi:hypothetical protein